MTVNIKNGPLAALLYAIGLDASNKGGRTRINSNATSAPLTTNDNTQGYQIGATWTRSDTRQMWVCADATTNAAVWTLLELSEHPGYIVGNWYVPSGITFIAGGSAPSANSIRLFPSYIKERITINSLGVRVSTLFASGNVQAAIYAANTATGRPTGNALASTASMSTTSVASVNAAVSLQLEPGLYWFGTCMDNATSALAAVSASSIGASSTIGSATQANDLGAGGLTSISVIGTFGTWPDMTSASFVETNGSGGVGIVQFKIGSVP